MVQAARSLKKRNKKKASSGKLQAPSDTTCGCVDNFKKDLTMVQGYCRMSIERINI
jgi:hypothetical protein